MVVLVAAGFLAAAFLAADFFAGCFCTGRTSAACSARNDSYTSSSTRLCRSPIVGSASTAATTSLESRSSRIPACTYSVSAEMRRPLAIWDRISALGFFTPRSIWLR